MQRDNRHGNGLHAIPCCQGDLVWQNNGFDCPFCLSLQFITRVHTCKHVIRKFVSKWPRYLRYQFNNVCVTPKKRFDSSSVICVHIISLFSCDDKERKVIRRETPVYVLSCSVLYQLQIITFSNHLCHPLIVVAGPVVPTISALSMAQIIKAPFSTSLF